MKIAIGIFAGVALVLLLGAYFLGMEHLRKFRFLKVLSEHGNTVTYHWNGARRPQGTRNIVLRSKTGQPFFVLAGAQFPTFWGEGIDPVAVGSSNPEGVLVVKAFFGRNPVKLYFLVADSTEVVASMNDDDQRLKPDLIMPHHLVHWLL